MSRPLRFIPEDGALVEVTTRCFQSRLLLTPGPLFNEIILGVLARAARLYGIGVVCSASSYPEAFMEVPSRNGWYLMMAPNSGKDA